MSKTALFENFYGQYESEKIEENVHLFDATTLHHAPFKQQNSDSRQFNLDVTISQSNCSTNLRLEYFVN